MCSAFRLSSSGGGLLRRVRYHLNDQDGGETTRGAHRRVAAVDRGEVEAFVMTASGCGRQVKDYGHLLAQDRLRDKATRIAALRAISAR